MKKTDEPLLPPEERTPYETPRILSSFKVPTTAEIEATRSYFTAQRAELARQLNEIEAFLGFINESDSLAVRVAKIEAFLGVKAT